MGAVGDCYDDAVGESSTGGEEGADPPPAVADPGRGALGDLRVYIEGWVQPAASALHARYLSRPGEQHQTRTASQRPLAAV